MNGFSAIFVLYLGMNVEETTPEEKVGHQMLVAHTAAITSTLVGVLYIYSLIYKRSSNAKMRVYHANILSFIV